MVDPDGALERPLIAFHKLADEAVPVESTGFYDALTQLEGSGDFFVQMYTPRVEGPSYTGRELRAALKLLLRWIDEGERPQPGILEPDPEFAEPDTPPR